MAEVAALRQQASDLNNLGQRQIKEKSYEKAIESLQQSVAIKVRYFGGDQTVTAAVGFQGLADACLSAGRLEEAKDALDRAYEIRVSQGHGPALDRAVTRESLGLYWEAMGDGKKAKQIRMENDEEILCACDTCRGPLLSVKTAKSCSACSCVFYCNAVRQKGDWRRHKKTCKSLQK